jgi:hypothetical protein
MVSITAVSYVALGLQVVTLLVILYGVYLMRVKRQMRHHGLIMANMVVLNIITVAAVMAPTYYGMGPGPGTSSPPVMLAHHYLGLLALAMTAVVAFSWVLRGAKTKGCLGTGLWGRTIMRATFSIWIASILLGIATLISLL